MKINFKQLLPYLIALVVFILVAIVYFMPVTEGYKLRQYDIMQYKGMSNETHAYRDKFGSEPLWTNAAFAGGPTTFISQKYYNNWLNHIEKAMQLWLPHPLNILFIYMLGFFILFLCLKIDPWLALAGSFMFAFSTYNFLIIEAGHNSKAYAMAWMAPVIGSIIYIYREKALWGTAMLALFFGLQLEANHMQMTYYMVMIIATYGIFELVQFIVVRKEIKQFLIRSAFVIGGLIVGLLPNYSMLSSILATSKETTRDQSTLTISPDGKKNDKDKTGGLDRSYITDYSYGIRESMNLMVPNASGTNETLGTHTSIIENIENPQAAQQIAQFGAYWSDEKNGGPTYLGAVAIALFILSFFFIKDLIIWGFLLVCLLALMLAWGKNYPGLTNFFIDYVPGYDKFRAVTTVLSILQILVPFMGIWGIHHLVKNQDKFKKDIKPFLIAASALVGLIFFMFIIGSTGSYMSTNEKAMFAESAQKAGNNADQLNYINDIRDGLIGARFSLFMNDALRTALFMLIPLALIFMFIKGWLNKYILYAGIGLASLIDLWAIDVRFLNNDTFPNTDTYISWVKAEEMDMPFYASAADYTIFELESRKQPELLQSIAKLENDLQKQKQENDAENPSLTPLEAENIRFRELNFATNYRVLTLNNPFNNATPSYFHKSLGGYHGVKQKRIQEIIEFYYQNELPKISEGLNSNNVQKIQEAMSKIPVLNMMNAKYIIFNPEGSGFISVSPDTVIPTPKAGLLVNEYAMGNAWFVKDIKEVNTDDEEILALGKTNLRTTAIFNGKMKEIIKAKAGSGEGSIKLTSYRPNKLVYECESKGSNIAVFSEVFTGYGWKAKVDGKETPIARANYLLRSISIPDGKYTIEFSFDLPSYHTGEKISLVGSLLLVLLVIGGFYFTFIRSRHKAVVEDHKSGVID